MSDPSAPDQEKGFWPDWLTPRRAFDFARNVISLERSVSTLQEENRDLRIQVTRLQQQLSNQGSNIELLTKFIEGAIDAKVELATERYLRSAQSTFTSGDSKE